MLTDNANMWPSGAPFDWNANPRRVRCRGCGREFEQRSRNNVYCTKECREREARKKDAAKPIPEAAYMQRVRAIAETMPPWLARAYTASRREAAGIREL